MKPNPNTIAFRCTFLALLLLGSSVVYALDDIVIFLDDVTPGDGCWEFSSAGAAAGGKVMVGKNNCIPIDTNENANPGGKDSLKITYELPFTPGASWFANVAAPGWPTHDLTNYTYLSFVVKGQISGGKLTVRLEDDANNRGQEAPNAVNPVPVDVSSDWTEFRFPLNKFDWRKEAWLNNKDVPRRDRIMQVSFFSQPGSSGTVWIDDIRFIGPKVNFTLVPQSGNGANAWADTIEGRVSNVDDFNPYKIALYALGDKWYIQPFEGDLIEIQPDGTWSTGTHLGTKYAALLVKASYKPPAQTVKFPAISGDVLAITTATPILVTPKLGASGDLVTITMDPKGPNPDQNFGKQQGTSKVTFNGVDAGTAEQWGETQIKVRVPQEVTSGPVIVTVDGVSWIGTIQERGHPQQSLPDDTKFTVVEVDGEATPNTLPADGKSTATIKATVREKGSGISITDASVTMQVTKGTGSISSVTNKRDGTYTAIYTASKAAGTETITIKPGSKLVTVQLTETPNCVVWPGDTNNDGIVDIEDVGPIARHWERRGPRRENASTTWKGQPAPCWEPKAATYADANGDGIIDIGDVGAIGRNWERTHDGVLAAPPVASILSKEINHRKYVTAYTAMLSALEADPIGKEAVELKRGLQQLIRLAQADPPPKKSLLEQNFPNPFNPETWIPYQLAEGGDVTIRIYDVTGDLVRTIALGYKGAGRYLSQEDAAYWDGRNSEGSRVASGVYFYQLEAGNFRATRKLIVAK